MRKTPMSIAWERKQGDRLGRTHRMGQHDDNGYDPEVWLLVDLSSKSDSASPSACLSLSFLSREVELGLELPSEGCHMDKTNGECSSQLKTGTREALGDQEPLSFTDTDPQGCTQVG